MATIPLLLSLFAISIISMDLSLSIALHIKLKIKWTAWFIVLLSSLLGLALLFALQEYSSLVYTGTPRFVLSLIFEAFFYLDSSFLCVFLCFFSNWVIARPMPLSEKIVVIINGSFYFLSALFFMIFRYILSDSELSTVVLEKLIYGFGALSIFYVVMVMIINFGNISNRRVKAVSITLIVISCSIFPLFLFSMIFPEVQSLFLPIYAILYSVAFLVFLCVAVNTKNEEADDSQKPSRDDEGVKRERYERYHLTQREIEIVSLIKEGYTNKEIAQELGISFNTVSNHIANIFDKTNVRCRIDLLNLLEEARW